MHMLTPTLRSEQAEAPVAEWECAHERPQPLAHCDVKVPGIVDSQLPAAVHVLPTAGVQPCPTTVAGTGLILHKRAASLSVFPKLTVQYRLRPQYRQPGRHMGTAAAPWLHHKIGSPMATTLI
jgi:hypothetical protein